MGRDVKAVHGDVTALIKAVVVDRQDGKVAFPYDGVHVDFVPGKAAQGGMGVGVETLPRSRTMLTGILYESTDRIEFF